MQAYTKQIEQKIKTFNRGKVFIAEDFLDTVSYETIRRTLNRFVEEKKIKRIMPGFYYKPKYSELIEEYEAPSINELATAIGRKYNWDIAPSQNAALNMFSLSTQVPTKYEYVSSGKTIKYNIGDIEILFKKVKQGEISNMSFKTASVIQAIKGLGKDKINEEDMKIISSKLTPNERENLLKEAKYARVWIYDTIKQIVEVGNE